MGGSGGLLILKYKNTPPSKKQKKKQKKTVFKVISLFQGSDFFFDFFFGRGGEGGCLNVLLQAAVKHFNKKQPH